MCEVDDILRNLKAIFAAGDLFAAEKATETWQNMNQLIWKETVSEIYFRSLREDQYTLNSFMQNT